MKSQKITTVSQGRPQRWYDDACGAAHGLELLGERWALLVVRELVFGPRRFGELRAGLPGISANILAQRLGGLEAAGVLRRRTLPPPTSMQVYELTPWGQEAEAVLMVLGRWAARSPAHDPTLPISAASLMLSFRTMFDAQRAGGMRGRIGFRFGVDGFVVTVAEGAIAVARGDAAEADLTITGAAGAVAALVYGGVPAERLEAQGALALTGDRALGRRFAALFPLPDKAA